MKKIAILGTGGFAREVLTLIENINARTPLYKILGFVDSHLAEGTMVNGYPVIGDDDKINATEEPLALALAFGEPHLKEQVRAKFTNPLISFPTLIHPSVIIGNANYVTIGQGCIICAGCILTTDITIQDFVTLNLACTVGHDAVIGQFSSFMPSSNISGEVNIEKNVYGGTGIEIINQIRIGANAIIGAGAVVTHDIPSDCTAVGIPAKPIKCKK